MSFLQNLKSKLSKANRKFSYPGSKILCILLLTGVFLILLFHNDFLYQDPIVKVTNVSEKYLTKRHGFNGQEEDSYQQTLTVVVKNGEHKGETLTIQNDYSRSEITSARYKKGDKLFVKLSDDSDKQLQASVKYCKRDSYLMILIYLFLVLLIALSKKQGLLTFLSLVLNLITFLGGLYFYKKEAFFNWIWIIEVVFFVVSTLLIISGWKRKTVGTILSTLISVAIVSVLYYFIIYKDSNLPYDMLPCMVAYLPLDKVFFISTIFGLLGAVMDVAITINTSVHELVLTTPNLTFRPLLQSIFEIGHDIMGTMVNVMFFSYLSGSLPLIVLKVSNCYTLSTIVTIDYVFDIIRFLVGSIGIVLSIPISGLVAVLLFRKDLVRKNAD